MSRRKSRSRSKKEKKSKSDYLIAVLMAAAAVGGLYTLLQIRNTEDDVKNLQKKKTDTMNTDTEVSRDLQKALPQIFQGSPEEPSNLDIARLQTLHGITIDLEK